MLASTIRRMVGPVLRECPRECGVVSMTRVEVSADASYVTIYISALHKADIALAFLEERRNDLQRELGSLQRKRIPLLRFRIDQTVEHGNRLDELLGSSQGE
jgi:ribosome-binding factor A